MIGIFREGFSDYVVDKVVPNCVESYFSQCDFLSQDYLFSIYNRGASSSKLRIPGLKAGSLPKSFRDAIQSLFVNNIFEIVFLLFSLYRQRNRRPVVICTLPMIATLGIQMRRLGLAIKIVYWSIDWYPNSKSALDGSLGRLLMSIFMQRLDKFCYERADAAWDLTSGITSARNFRWGADLKSRPHSVVYPLARPSKQNSPPPLLSHKVVFIGRDYYFTQGGELWASLAAIKRLRDEGLDINLEVFTGMDTITDRQSRFLDFANSLGVKAAVHLHVKMPYDKASEMIGDCICGLALFSPSRISTYAFSGKVMNYFESGIPVVITRNSAISSLVEQNRAGVVIEGVDEVEVARAIRETIDKQAMFRIGVKAIVGKHMNGETLLNNLEIL